MEKTNEVTYPDVTVHLSTGVDGSVFSVIAAVTKQLRRSEHGPAVADAVAREAMDQGSYDDVLRYLMRTVNVT